MDAMVLIDNEDYHDARLNLALEDIEPLDADAPLPANSTENPRQRPARALQNVNANQGSSPFRG